MESGYASEIGDHLNANHVLAARLAETSADLLEEWRASDDPMKNSMGEEMLEMERGELIQMLLPCMLPLREKPKADEYLPS